MITLASSPPFTCPSSMIRLFAFAVCLLTLAACTTQDSDDSSAPIVSAEAPTFWADHIGSRHVLMRGDLGATVSLDTLAQVLHLYALGPVEGLRGEVTIYDGVPSIASIAPDGSVEVDTTFAHRAAFLAYASAPEWSTLPLTASLASLTAIESFVRSAAEEAGLDLDQAFPFRLEGRADSLAYHVIFRSDDAPHDHAAHQRAKVMFDGSGETVRIVGFWAGSEGEGVYTHPGSRIHLHAIVGDGGASGHIDALHLAEGATLYLPR